MEYKMGQVWQHHRNGEKYVIDHACMVKCDGIWHPGVVYHRQGYPGCYVRTEVNFSKKFTRVLE